MKQLVQKLEKLFGKNELQDLPRRARRGFSLAEMTLVLIVSAFILQTGIEVATSHTKRQITQRTAANMSRMADDVQTYMDRNYFTILADLNAAPNNVIERDWSDLISANLISMNDIPVSPDGGDLRLFFTLRGDTVYSVIMSFDGAASTYSPKPDPNTKFAGRIQRNAGAGYACTAGIECLCHADIAAIAQMVRNEDQTERGGTTDISVNPCG